MGVCNCPMFCCTLLYVHSSIAIIMMGKRELIALLNLSSCCLVMVELLFLAVPGGCLQFVIVVFPDHTHLLFLNSSTYVICHALNSQHWNLVLLRATRSIRIARAVESRTLWCIYRKSPNMPLYHGLEFSC